MFDLLMPKITTLAIGLPGHGEWIILLILGLLIFGRRLPEIGRSVGRSIVEFKKGIKGIEDEIEDSSSKPSPRIEEKASPQIPTKSAEVAPPKEDTKVTVGPVDEEKPES